MKKTGQTPTTPKHEIQTLMKLEAVTEKEIDGIGMGVLSDGSTYLTARGLARMCGIDHSVVLDVSNGWSGEQFKPRGRRIADLLANQRFDGASLFHVIEVDGSPHHAFPEEVCMAFLEYYAFEAGPNVKEQALKNFRLLARSSFRAFIYTAVGYDPTNRIPQAWRDFHDRVSLAYDYVPHGYFSVFKEIANMVVAMIQSGVPVGEKTVPDGSVGQTWGRHWRDNNLDEDHGERIEYEHNYPDHFPQAASNPQKPWAYPDSALPEFRRWMREIYFPEKFPNYIRSQVAKHALPPSVAMLAIEAVIPPKIEGS